MELDASIEPTIGPYEVYQDEWFNFKAAFEAFITVRDAAESKKLERFSSELQELEDHLPIDPRYRRAKLGENDVDAHHAQVGTLAVHITAGYQHQFTTMINLYRIILIDAIV